MIFFAIFTVIWLMGGAALGYLTSTHKTGLHVIWIAAVVWGLSIGIGWPAPHGVLTWWEVGGVVAIHLLLTSGAGFTFGRLLKKSQSR